MEERREREIRLLDELLDEHARGEVALRRLAARADDLIAALAESGAGSAGEMRDAWFSIETVNAKLLDEGPRELSPVEERMVAGGTRRIREALRRERDS